MKNLEISDLSVIMGGGFFFSAVASIAAPLISTTPEFLHWFPLGFAVVGMVFGFWVSREVRK